MEAEMDEATLEKRIRERYDAMPMPDPQRLTAVLRRIETAATPSRRQPLLRQRWLTWLLLAGAATAAAAAGYRWYANRTEAETAASANYVAPDDVAHGHRTAPETATAGTRHALPPATHRTESTPPAKRPSTVIYMR